MYKRAVSLVVTLVVLLSVACSGGSSYSVMNPRTQPMMMEGMAMAYSKLNGKVSPEIIMAPEGGEIYVEVVTEAGSLSVFVSDMDDKDNVIYRADNVPTSSFTIPLPGEGLYQVWVEAVDHKGSYWIGRR